MPESSPRHKLFREKMVLKFKITITKPLVASVVLAILLVLGGYALYVAGQHNGQKQATKRAVQSTAFQSALSPISPQEQTSSANAQRSTSSTSSNGNKQVANGIVSDLQKNSFKLAGPNGRQTAVVFDSQTVVLDSAGKTTDSKKLKVNQKITVMGVANSGNTLQASQIFIQK